MQIDVAAGLKALREEAGLTMRQVADHLGWRQTRYQHYEDRYAKPYLPADLAHRLADLFAEHNIDPARVLELGGVGGEPPPRPESIPSTTLGQVASKSDGAPAPDELSTVLRSEFRDGMRLEIRCNGPLDAVAIRRLRALLAVHEAEEDS